jgi:hypothetical protein
LTNGIDEIRVIYTPGGQANAARCQSVEKRISGLINRRNVVKNKIHCFALLQRLFATSLKQLDAFGGDLAGYGETEFPFTDFFIYSKHKLPQCTTRSN